MQTRVVAGMNTELMMVLEIVKLAWENGSDDKAEGFRDGCTELC